MVSFVVFVFSGIGFGQGVNPVDRLRDYNGTYAGKDEVLKFIGNIITHVDIEGFQTNQFFENGNRVVVLGNEKQRIKKNGELLEQDWVQSFIVENGLITRLDEYANTSHAAKLFSK